MTLKSAGYLKNNIAQYFFIFFVVFSIYIWSLPRTVVLEDDGYFILASYYNGFGHPPGYPLFTLLGYLSTLIPWGSPAFQVHMLTAFFGTLTCLCLYKTSLFLLNSKFFATIVALVFAFSKAFWSQSIIADVYTLNTLIFFFLTVMCIYLISKKTSQLSPYMPFMLGLIYGLGLSNHWPLLILSSPMLVILLWTRLYWVMSKWPIVLAGIFTGLLPYFWMVYRSHANLDFSFYGQINNFTEFLSYVSREGYADVDSSQSAGWDDKLRFIKFVLVQTAEQCGLFGFLLILVGVIMQWRYWSFRVCCALLTGFLGNTFLLILLLGFDYDFLHQAIFKVYPLIAYGICVIWLGLGLKIIVGLIKKQDKNNAWSNTLHIYVGIFIVVTTLLTNFGDNYRAKDSWAEDYARTILNSLEPGAVLFSYSDMSAGPLYYVHRLLAVRPDVTLYSGSSILPNQMHRHASFSRLNRDKLLDAFIRSLERPVYFIEDIPAGYGIYHYGLYMKLDKQLPKGAVVFTANKNIVDYLDTITSKKPFDYWQQIQYWQRVTNKCQLTAGLMINTDDFSGKLNDDLKEYCYSYYGLIDIIPLLLKHKTKDLGQIKQLLKETETFLDQAITKKDRAQFYNLRGVVYLLEDNVDEALNNFDISMRVWPSPANEAANYLTQLRN